MCFTYKFNEGCILFEAIKMYGLKGKRMNNYKPHPIAFAFGTSSDELRLILNKEFI